MRTTLAVLFAALLLLATASAIPLPIENPPSTPASTQQDAIEDLAYELSDPAARTGAGPSADVQLPKRSGPPTENQPSAPASPQQDNAESSTPKTEEPIMAPRAEPSPGVQLSPQPGCEMGGQHWCDPSPSAKLSDAALTPASHQGNALPLKGEAMDSTVPPGVESSTDAQLSRLAEAVPTGAEPSPDGHLPTHPEAVPVVQRETWSMGF